MAPRKKANSSSSSSSKKSESSQPTKFGIQHFFERHTQNHKSDAVSSTPQNPKPDLNTPSASSRNDTFSIHRNPKSASHSAAATKCSPNSAVENTPPENLIPVATDADDEKPTQVSPEISKSLPLKRFKFSPGMLIKQSQDEGGDEITWKVSPVNERLQAVSKLMPETIKVLADSSRLNSLAIRECSQNKASPSTAGKIEKWLSSPTPKATESSLLSANWLGLKRVNPCQDVDIHGNANIVNTTVSSQQSPFRTPPSLSYCHDKSGPRKKIEEKGEKLANAVACDGTSDQMGLKQHKKALLELLDQVEDVISVEDSVSSDMEACTSKFQDKNGGKMLVKADPAVKGVAAESPLRVSGTSSNSHFLVLEVSEKRWPADSFGAQCLSKVLRLLNEQSGEERVVYLKEEWLVVQIILL